MIPYGNKYYSAFPLGAVLSMIPVALLQKASLIHNFPARILAALIAGACVYFFFQLAKAFGSDYSSLKPKPLARRILLALFPVFATWTWCNLGMGGAWQIALGLALLGRNRSALFHVGATVTVHCWSLFRACCLETEPSCSSQHLSTFIFSGAAQTKTLPASRAPLE